MEPTTEDLKAQLTREVDRRDAMDAEAAARRERIGELIAELRGDPHNVGVAELARLAKVSPQAIYKALDR